MSPTRQPYELALLHWVDSQVNIPVIFSDSDGPDQEEYATVRVGPMPQRGQSTGIVGDVDNGTKVDAVQRTQYSGVCAIEVFGPQARGLIETIRTSIGLSEVREAARIEGISLVSPAGSAQNLAELLGIRTRARMLTEVVFHWCAERAYTTDVIETVSVSQT